MGFNFSRFLGYKDPSKAASPYLDRIPQEAGQYLQPFYNASQNPGQTQNGWGEDYKKSPGYNFAMSEALGASENAAAAGGMAGSPMHSQQNMQMASDIASQDYNNWQNRNMGIYNTGAGAGQSMQQMIQDLLYNKSSMAYRGAENRNANNARMHEMLLKTAMTAAGFPSFNIPGGN